MRLYSAKVPKLSNEIVTAVTKDGDVETTSPREVQLDVEAVLNQYVKDEQEVSERAKTMMAQRSLPQTEFGRLKKLVADERKIKIGDDAIDYILDQLVEMLMHSTHVDEIFAEDHVLRRKMREPLRAEAAQEQDLQTEVRAQLRHVQEGTSMYEVEYRRMMDDLKRRKGL
jgi:uncharacterized protein